MNVPLLEIDNLRVHFLSRQGPFWRRTRRVVRAVDGVSLSIREGETFGLVGESGCGKSTTARAVVGLAPITSGAIRLNGHDLAGLPQSGRHSLRRNVQMIFQDPFASLNPRMTVGRIIREPMTIHRLHASAHRRQLEVLRLMELVGLSPKLLNRYPHEFSGGQRQRVGIARALALQPNLVLCDEPVSALDVSIQAQVVNLLMELKQQLGLAYLFIAHDLGVVRHVADRVGVMYLGRLVEVAAADQLYRNPLHPYTQALLSAVPQPDPVAERQRQRIVLVGEVPSPDKQYPGCPFADRCPLVEPRCRESVPPLQGDTHQVACFLAEEGRSKLTVAATASDR